MTERILWVLLTDRAGDNAQALALARACRDFPGWRVIEKTLAVRRPHNLRTHGQLPGTDHVDLPRSDTLAAPWPDAVLSVGFISAPVAAWIKAQAASVRIVQLGRPRMADIHFDLLVSTPQYRLPAGEKYLGVTLPLSLPDESALDREADSWRGTFVTLPRPLVALAIGGQEKNMVLTPDTVRDLLARVLRFTDCGTLVTMTSPRSPAWVNEVIASHAKAGQHFFPWNRDRPNPYRALLRLADAFVTTNDSASMAADALYGGRAVFIHEFPQQRKIRPWRELLLARPRRALLLHREERDYRGLPRDWIGRMTDALITRGWVSPNSSNRLFLQHLYRCGLVRPLPDRPDASLAAPPLPVEFPKVVARIRELVAS